MDNHADGRGGGYVGVNARVPHLLGDNRAGGRGGGDNHAGG